jgi:hypothetical protein
MREKGFYKVTNFADRSLIMTVNSVQYAIGKRTFSKRNRAKIGWHLFVFQGYRNACDFRTQLSRSGRIYKAEIGPIIPLPQPPGGTFFEWPAGTVMTKWVKLLERVR